MTDRARDPYFEVVAEDVGEDGVYISVNRGERDNGRPIFRVTDGGPDFVRLLEEKENLIALGQFHVNRLRSEVEALKKELRRLQAALSRQSEH